MGGDGTFRSGAFSIKRAVGGDRQNSAIHHRCVAQPAARTRVQHRHRGRKGFGRRLGGTRGRCAAVEPSPVQATPGRHDDETQPDRTGRAERAA